MEQLIFLGRIREIFVEEKISIILKKIEDFINLTGRGEAGGGNHMCYAGREKPRKMPEISSP